MELPADIDRIATDIMRADYSGPDKDSEWEMYLAIGRAILAERLSATERAAKIADSWRDTAKKLVGKELDEERRLYHGIAADMARDIAAAIRSQP